MKQTSQRGLGLTTRAVGGISGLAEHASDAEVAAGVDGGREPVRLTLHLSVEAGEVGLVDDFLDLYRVGVVVQDRWIYCQREVRPVSMRVQVAVLPGMKSRRRQEDPFVSPMLTWKLGTTKGPSCTQPPPERPQPLNISAIALGKYEGRSR